MEYDHTKVFNLSFSYKLPKPIHNNLILGEVVNGWQLSGYTTYEDGAPYQTQSVEHERELSIAPRRVRTQRSCNNLHHAERPADPNSIENINTWFGSSQYENGTSAGSRLRSAQWTC